MHPHLQNPNISLHRMSHPSQRVVQGYSHINRPMRNEMHMQNMPVRPILPQPPTDMKPNMNINARIGIVRPGQNPAYQSQYHVKNIPPQQQQQHVPTTATHIGLIKDSEEVKMQSIKQQPSNTQQNSDISKMNKDSSSSSNNNNNNNNSLSGSTGNYENMDNIKEKTPMCLVNELARYNKITHQYRLTSEAGPAHKKRFTVALKLGEEEYSAEGPSIKKAQHIAAAEAMQKTKYTHPPPKVNRTLRTKKNQANITPTVELNALAMKQGLHVIYTQEAVEPPPNMLPSQMVNPTMNHPPNIARPNQFNGRTFGAPVPKYQQPETVLGRGVGRTMFPRKQYGKYMGDKVPEQLYKISLKVGQHQFEGIGNTPQSARHSAASRALEVLKTAESPPVDEQIKVHESPTYTVDDLSSDLKSPISLVHEIALKRQLQVSFEVQAEKGPPHMKVFTTICKVGDLVTEGEGNGKKVSRKRAAEKMLEELKKLGPLSPSPVAVNLKQKRKPQTTKRKNRNLIKEKPNQEPVEEVNPISHLIQLQQAKKEKEPTYTLIEEKGAPRRREFVIEVSASGVSCTGSGPNKKTAKRIAAQNLLVAMGIAKPEKVKDEVSASEKPEKPKKVSFKESKSSNESKQIVPGVLILKPETEVDNSKKLETTNPTPTQTESSADSALAVNPKEQLLYLAQLLDFQVQFSDFPKGNHGEFLTLVTLSTCPPQLCHGAGSSTEESSAQAALKALQLLRKLGLDSLKPKSSDAKKSDETK